ncbi:hypothetical protein [Endozoicomonas sp.]|uniref:hypothetical protein n=1 Tax=Endozoicomonas sp. TaxID=1892382 RepID=UPI00383BADD7
MSSAIPGQRSNLLKRLRFNKSTLLFICNHERRSFDLPQGHESREHTGETPKSGLQTHIAC